MSRVPTVGSDSNNWGAVLNDYLAQGHNSGGSNKGTLQVFNVKDDTYGAIGNGVHDDTTNIQAAIDAAIAAGGGIVFFPAGTYLCNTKQTTFGILKLSGSNIELRGAGPASVIKTTGLGGGYGILLHINPNATDVRNNTVYTISGSYSAGSMTVTTATAANAGNFAAGDLILIRTGQVIDPGTGNPDAEINEVISASASTGVITLKYPLVKSYAQEYYVSGTSGRTSTSVTANLAPFGVSKITSQMIQNVRIRDLQLTSSSVGYWGIDGSQIVGLDVENVRWNGNGAGLFEAGIKKFCRVKDCRAHCTNSGGAVIYNVAVGTCDSDTEFADNILTVEDGVSQIHLNEGAANINVVGNTLKSAQIAADRNNISIRGRAYNHTIKNNIIVNGGNSIAIAVDQYSPNGGIIEGNTLIGGFSDAINISADGWIVGINNVVNGNTTFLASTVVPMQRGNNTVTPSLTTAPLCVIPLRSFVVGVHIWVEEAFNSSGTDFISVGNNSFNNLLTSVQDVSSTGYFAPTLNNHYLHNSAGQINAYYFNGGTAPTTGKAVVVVEFCSVRNAYA